MKLVGKTIDGMPPYEIVDVYECQECGLRVKGFKRKCIYCQPSSKEKADL